MKHFENLNNLMQFSLHADSDLLELISKAAKPSLELYELDVMIASLGKSIFDKYILITLNKKKLRILNKLHNGN